MNYILLTWLLAPIWWPLAMLRRVTNGRPRRIVIFEIAGIGDVVCSTDLFAQLRARYPDAVIDLVVDPIAASLAPALPMINRVIQFPYPRQRGVMGRLRLIKLCLNYNAGVCLIPSAAQLTGFCLAAMPWRLSILPGPLNNSYSWLRPLMTETVVHQPGTYFPQAQAQLFQALGLADALSIKKIPPPAAKKSGRLPITSQKTLVGLLVGSGRALKRLEPEQLLRLIEGLVTQSPDVNVVLIGGPADKVLAEKLLEVLAPNVQASVIDLTGCCTLAELPAALDHLALLIGVDSGVTHMADALGVPIVCIAGPVDLGEVYEPGSRRALLSAALPCYPCSRVFDTPSSCHLGHRDCLRQLNLDGVLANAAKLLEIGRG